MLGVFRLLWVLFLLAVIEGVSRGLGWYDFAIKRDRHVVWDMAWTQKQDVQNVRRGAEEAAASNGKSKTSYAVSSTSRLNSDVIDEGRSSAGM